MKRWIGIGVVAVAALAAGCGGTPIAPTASGVSIASMLVQIDNVADGSHNYTVTYGVRNSGTETATLTGVDAVLSAKGATVRSFNVGFPSGRDVPVSQTAVPTVTTFTTPAGTPLADSLALTVHYHTSSGDQTVSRTITLG